MGSVTPIDAARRKDTPATPATAATAVNGQALLHEVREFVDRFVVMSDEQRLVVALWTIHTHCFEAALQTPYILVTSPEKQCGKSRLIDVLELLVARPWRALLPSEAVLYRKVEKARPTLLLDEADTIFPTRASGSDRYEHIRGLLNEGHRKGATVTRCAGANQELRDFNVYCPKLIAGIGVLPDTIADRGVPIRMERKTASEHVEKFRRRDEESGATELNARVAEWAEAHEDVLTQARPDLPDELSDRMQEGTEPLLAIADEIGCGEDARRAFIKLTTGARVDSVESQRVRLLRDLKLIFRKRDAALGCETKAMSTSMLLVRLAQKPESEWAHFYGRKLEAKDLANLLKPYGVSPTTVRLPAKNGAEIIKKGYKRTGLAGAWERYL